MIEEVQEILGIDLNILEQGSPEWRQVKLGVLSASECHEFMGGEKTQKFKKYVAKKIGEVMCAEPAEEFNAKALQWGKDNEDAARLAYQLKTKHKVKEVGFVFKKDDIYCGCSPDGIVEATGYTKGLEIKCPVSQYVFPQALMGEIKKEWELQVQYSMYVTGYNEWDLTIYDPRCTRKKLFIKTYARDELIAEKIHAQVSLVRSLMDTFLSDNGYRFRDQWRDKIEVARRD